jgi:hypothetical protein
VPSDSLIALALRSTYAPRTGARYF